jgi:hypothetical protein
VHRRIEEIRMRPRSSGSDATPQPRAIEFICHFGTNFEASRTNRRSDGCEKIFTIGSE